MHWRGMFGIRRGDFHLLILLALSEKPMHGYALMQELGRTYERPMSAGMIYPTLQELEDLGYVKGEEVEGKKVYSVTAEGSAYLERNKEAVDRLRAGRENAGRLGRFGFMKDLRDIQAMVVMNLDTASEEKMKRVQEILAEARKKVASVVFE
jgi:DNA-binding PadR family transcriptional regulator